MKTAKKHAQHAITGFELTQKIIKNLSQFDLTPSAKLVLVLLTTHYNETKNGAVVFPSMPYISETLGLGLTSVKQAIKDLLNHGLIIKSKRDKIRGNFNKYILTLKVQNMTCEQPKNECFKKSETDLFMITNKKEKIKEQTKKEKSVVAFSLKHKTITLDEVPDVIKNNPKVKDACAYWASLSEQARITYREGEKSGNANTEKKAADRYYARQIKETQEKIAQNKVWTAVNPKECDKLKKVLFNNWGIKK